MRLPVFLKYRGGQMTLPFVLLIGGVIVEIAIAGAVITYFLSNSGYGERLSARAQSAAQSGLRDATVKIAQNKEYSSASCESPATYSISINNDSASVSVCRTSDSAINKYIYTVTSIGSAFTRQKKFVGIILSDMTTGEIELKSMLEQSI